MIYQNIPIIQLCIDRTTDIARMLATYKKNAEPERLYMTSPPLSLTSDK